MAVVSFDNIDDMMSAMEQDLIAADRSVAEWQNHLALGDFFVRVGPGNVAIYCEVVGPSPDDEEEVSWYAQDHLRNFRICKAYSVFCPEGEIGDVHISTAALKISKANFELAKSQRWKAGFHGI